MTTELTTKAGERTQHTPGPWAIHEWQNDRDQTGVMSHGLKDGVWKFTATETEPKFRIVAGVEHLRESSVYGSFEGCHVAELPISYEGRNETEANARLIAAAPEMYAMLCSLSRVFNDQNFTDRHGYGERIDAILAKAKSNGVSVS